MSRLAEMVMIIKISNHFSHYVELPTMTGELLYLENSTSIGFERLSVRDGQTICSIEDEILMTSGMTVHTVQYLSSKINFIVFGNDSNQTIAQMYYTEIRMWSSPLPLGNYLFNITATILPGYDFLCFFHFVISFILES
jgi:hypothetical protein